MVYTTLDLSQFWIDARLWGLKQLVIFDPENPKIDPKILNEEK